MMKVKREEGKEEDENEDDTQQQRPHNALQLKAWYKIRTKLCKQGTENEITDKK